MCLVAIILLNLLNNDAGDKDDYDEVYCDDIDDCDVI